MSDNNKLETILNLFEGKQIRSVWDAEKEDYFFSVVDVIGALTESVIPRNYWSDLKRKLIKVGIDDRIENLKNCDKKLLFSEFRNKNITKEQLERDNIIRVNSWLEVQEELILDV